jgi:hypothetical protein
MSALVAAAIHCPLSENATGQNVTVMFSQNESQGKFCPPTVTDFITAEAIALINYTLWGCFTPPPPMVLLRHKNSSSIPIAAPQFELALRHFIQRSVLYMLCALLLQAGRSLITVGAAQSGLASHYVVQ